MEARASQKLKSLFLWKRDGFSEKAMEAVSSKTLNDFFPRTNDGFMEEAMEARLS